jgi:anti-sigma28 factor (negative regulator of flagellin synthesis)
MSMEAIKSVTTAYLREATAVTPRADTTVANSSTVSVPSDRVEISSTSLEIANYSAQAKRLTEDYRPDRVAALKIAVDTGNYPAPLVVEGLINLIGLDIKDLSISNINRPA